MEASITSKQSERAALGALALLLVGAAAAPAAGQELVVRQLVCSGNEPFWQVELTETAALLRRPGSPEVEETALSGALRRFTFLDPPWSVWRGHALDDPSQVLVAVVRAETCYDTMADLPPFDHLAVVSLPDGVAAVGCCRAVMALDAAGAPAADFASKSQDDWARLLLDLMPVIRSCVLDGPVAVAQVLMAWPMNRGLAGVRVADRDGRRSDCIAELADGRIERVDAVSEADPPLPGAGNPVFLPAREQAPLVDCGRLERVLDAQGTLQGWLHYAPCG